jgi:hypothetical protein
VIETTEKSADVSPPHKLTGGKEKRKEALLIHERGWDMRELFRR